MKKAVLLAIVVMTAGLNTWAQRSRYEVQEKETIRRTLEFSAGNGTRTLEIDNVSGSILVTGYDGRNVEVVANKTISAESQDKVQTAKQEVRLDITDQSDTVRIYVDEPNRCNCPDGERGWRNNRRWRNPGYNVKFDFDVRVPREATVRLRTVNDGSIKVENIAGDFDVDDVNGRVEMLEVSGSGRAYALNGGLKVTFASNPKKDSYFGSLNGGVEVAFQPNLSADLRFKTFNGGVYTDFPITALPTPAARAERRDGKFVYRSNGFQGARVGSGGPELQFDGFNGDVKILRRSR